MTASPTTPPAAPAAAGRARAACCRWTCKASPYLYIAPFFVIFAVFGLFPCSTRPGSRCTTGTWSGRAVHRPRQLPTLFADPDFWNAVVNTLGILVLATVPQLLLALVVAALLNQQLRARLLLRMGVLLPIVTSVAAVGIVFSQIFDRDAGMVNGLLHLSASPRSTGGPTSGRPGSPSRPWSTGAGPATTR